MATVPDMIERLGGVRPTAAALGIAPTTVQHWKNSGHAPSWRLPTLEAAYAAVTGPAHCSICSARAEHPSVRSCTAPDCPMRAREAA